MRLLRIVINVTQFDEPNTKPLPSELSVQLDISAPASLVESVRDDTAQEFEEKLSDKIDGFQWVQSDLVSYVCKPVLKISIDHVGLAEVRLADAADLQRFGKEITACVRDIVAAL